MFISQQAMPFWSKSSSRLRVTIKQTALLEEDDPFKLSTQQNCLQGSN